MDFPYGRTWLLDGATGTNLIQEGASPSGCMEKYILEHPDKLLSLQAAFLKAGADTLFAPTFGANSERLTYYGLSDQVENFNRHLVGLTKQIADDIPVGGNLSTAGITIGPEEERTFSELMGVYTQQAVALKAAGVDYFAIETMTSLTDIRQRFLPAESNVFPSLPVLRWWKTGLTASGTSALTCLVVLQELGVSAFGLNCSLSPAQMVPIFEELDPGLLKFL